MFDINIEVQRVNAAIGLHGAVKYRAQCGLVEGGLMFLGILRTKLEKKEAEIADLCYFYADAFTKEFKSVRCYDLRPTGFNENDEPHMCEKLTCKAIAFAYQYIIIIL